MNLELREGGCLSGVRVGEKTHFSPRLGAELEAGLHEVLSPSLAKSCWHNSELEVKMHRSTVHQRISWRFGSL